MSDLITIIKAWSIDPIVPSGLKSVLRKCKAEIERLTKALEAKPIGEPVAFRANVDGVWFVASTHKFMKATLEKSDVTAEIHPLYTTPPPSQVQALIADIDAIPTEYGQSRGISDGVWLNRIEAVIDKYRSTGNDG